jgi:CMP-N-acetylneuraminic acid synthetase
MLEGKKVLAFIGARSGSKGLKDKNIKPLGGKPLMAWTIEAALASSIIDLVVVSTDSKEYAEIAKRYGAQVIMRPEELSGDDASLMAALKHGYESIKEKFGDFDVLVNLQPTSPLRTSRHIDEALELFSQSRQQESIRIFSCSIINSKFSWAMRCDQEGNADFIDQDIRLQKKHNRQSNPELLLPNGAIFILPCNNLTQFYNGKTIPYIMDEQDSIDIDIKDDFDIAKRAISKLNL